MSMVFVKSNNICSDKYMDAVEIIKYGDVEEVRVLCSNLEDVKNNKLMSDLYWKLIEILGDIGKLYNYLATKDEKGNLYKYFRGYQIPYDVVMCMKRAVSMYYNIHYRKYDSEIDRFIGVYERLSYDCVEDFIDFVCIGDCSGVGELHELKVHAEELQERFLVYIIKGEYLKAYEMLGIKN